MVCEVQARFQKKKKSFLLFIFLKTMIGRASELARWVKEELT